MDEETIAKLQTTVLRLEKYFYKYLLTHNKVYIDRFFLTAKKLKRSIEKCK
jgi:hypothetical protein